MATPGPPDPTVRRALLAGASFLPDPSVLTEFAVGLTGLGVEIVATGGTHATLASAGIPSRPAEELTGIGRWFHGRIQTLHPGLLGGILAERTPDGLEELQRRGLLPIDLVAVTLYDFPPKVRGTEGPVDLVEGIDVGGVTLLRAAAKNYAAVVAVSDAREYPGLLEELRTHQGAVSAATRRRLALETFDRTSNYDRRISDALGLSEAGADRFPTELRLVRDRLSLRYGENPHQSAVVYRVRGAAGWPVPDLDLLKGESLSYTNLVDLDTAVGIVGEFDGPAASVVKHATPCGVAAAELLKEALARAVATDPVARYGCVVALNRPFEPDDADALKGIFVDLLAAPSFSAAALERLQGRSKVKVVRVSPPRPDQERSEVRSAAGRVLVQESDRRPLRPEELRSVTQRSADPSELDALSFAWRVVRHARSNAIVLAKGRETVGIGSGQPTRVSAVRLAVDVAGDRARGSVLASDAFFPFPDGIEAAGRAGVVAIVQPGGSLRDPEVIATADRFGVAMYFTGWRVFRH